MTRFVLSNFLITSNLALVVFLSCNIKNKTTTVGEVPILKKSDTIQRNPEILNAETFYNQYYLINNINLKEKIDSMTICRLPLFSTV